MILVFNLIILSLLEIVNIYILYLCFDKKNMQIFIHTFFFFSQFFIKFSLISFTITFSILSFSFSFYASTFKDLSFSLLRSFY